MTVRARLATGMLLLGLLGASAGCQTPGQNSNGTDSLASSSMSGTGTEGNGLLTAGPREQEGGGLLRTGAIMLGPGVGRNWWRWQGDGEWGF